MYCSNCGLAVAETLSYCNHCGARLNSSNQTKVPTTSREVKPELLVSSMVTTFVLGLLAISVLLGVMKSVLGLELGQLLAFAFLSFLIMLSLEAVFLRLLLRRSGRGEQPTRTEALPEQTTKELAAPSVQALREPLASVTEHTTRAFESIYADRNKTT